MKGNRRRIDLIDPHEFDEVMLSQEEILEYFFTPLDAVWTHGGDPSLPHAELTTGLCSDGYINCGIVLCHPKLSMMLAHQLVLRLEEAGVREVDWVVGSDHSAVTFSYEVARQLSLRYGRDVRHDFTERDPSDGNGKGQIWRRHVIEEGATVLQVEELVATRSTLENVRRAVEEGNPHLVRFHEKKGALVLRPDDLTKGFDDIIAPVRLEIQTWHPSECPLCKAGSKRLRPKTHWTELTKK